jgi:hypothetical protein
VRWSGQGVSPRNWLHQPEHQIHDQDEEHSSAHA